MSAEQMFRDLLRERAAAEPAERPRRSRRHLTDDQAARLLDAAAAVLAATRGLVSVGEQVLRERRDDLLARSNGAGRDERPEQANETNGQRTHIDLTY